MALPPTFDRDRLFRGLASMAVALAEAGRSNTQIAAYVDSHLGRIGPVTSYEVREVAAAVAGLLRPHERAEDREHRAAAWRVRAVLEAFADDIEEGEQ
jgi:hypothetical protein